MKWVHVGMLQDFYIPREHNRWKCSTGTMWKVQENKKDEQNSLIFERFLSLKLSLLPLHISTVGTTGNKIAKITALKQFVLSIYTYARFSAERHAQWFKNFKHSLVILNKNTNINHEKNA